MSLTIVTRELEAEKQLEFNSKAQQEEAEDFEEQELLSFQVGKPEEP